MKGQGRKGSKAQSEILRSASRALKDINTAKKRRSHDWDFAEWLCKHTSVKVGGRPRKWSFKGYEPYKQIAADLPNSHENWLLKGAQIGASTLMIGYNLYLPYWKGLDSAYALPDKVMIKPFMKTRFSKEQVRRDGDLGAVYQMHESDMYYDCGDNFLYFLGANVLSETMSRPLEQISLDEVTIINADAMEWMEDRLGAASFGQKNAFTMEMYPGGTAHVGYESGRQNVYLFKCPHCGEDEQNLEDEFYRSSMAGEEIPRCVHWNGRKWQVVCTKCGLPFSRESAGRWVAKHPTRDVNSWRLPQLIFGGLDLGRVMRRWLASRYKKSKRAKLHCSILAIPDAGDMQRINEQDMRLLKQDYKLQRSALWSVGGCDVGNWCHTVFYDLVQDQMRLIWAEKINSDHMESRICELLDKMNTVKYVMDAKPFAPQVRRIADAFPDVVVLHDYAGDGLQENEKTHADQTYASVREDRDDSLDYYCDLFNPEEILLMFPTLAPDEDGRMVDFENSEFAKQHYVGSQKTETEDKRLGKTVLKYRKNCDNHYFMAGNYARTSLVLLGQENREFVGLTPVFGSLNA